MQRWEKRGSLLLTFIFCLASRGVVLAQTTNFTNPASGSWYDAANWDAGVPVGTGTAVINNGGTALIADPNQGAVGSVILAGGATATFGTINVAVGSLTTNSDLRIGGNGSSAGSGAGTLIQSGGSVFVGGSGNLNLGFSSTTAGVNNGFGTYLLSGGTLIVTSSVSAIVGIAVGNGGAGYFKQTGGYVEADAATNSGIGLGRRGGSNSNGTYELQSGTVIVNILSVGGTIAGASSGQGTFIQGAQPCR